jgi:RNA polymerase sigma factor (sigma-70 family)
MSIAVKENISLMADQKLIEGLYAAYAGKLLGYTLRNYKIPEDDARNLVYKTIYRFAEVSHRYSFDHESKRTAFIFKTHINYLRNYFRDNKSFEHRNFEVELNEFEQQGEDTATPDNPKLKLLQQLLDEMEDWQRILLLMRGQGASYSEISKFVNKPENQLKVYYARLKKQLMEDMNDRLNNEKDGQK